MKHIPFYKHAYFLVLICCLVGCNNNSIYHQLIKIKKEGWAYSQTLTYKWTIKDTADWYSMSLKLEHLPNLDYRNVYVKCITRFPDSTKKEQILSLELFDETGKPFGKCSSSKCITEISLIAKTKFQFQGEYGLTIEQFGRDNVMKGLHSFELDLSILKNLH